jgi:hypothetical protein
MYLLLCKGPEKNKRTISGHQEGWKKLGLKLVPDIRVDKRTKGNIWHGNFVIIISLHISFSWQG